jgi:pimeloyl-ACP methyl ester carboxylesterase
MSIWSDPPIEMRFRTIDGLAIRFARSPERSQSALLLSPWPESLLAFAPIWERLAERAQLVAVDLPGFGHSERRDALLSPRAMGEFLVLIADAFGLRRPHVIAPDVGTAAALFAAAAHPDRFRSLVVGGGAAAYPLKLGGRLEEWVHAPDIDAYRSADPRPLVNAQLSGIQGYALPDFVREDYLSAYAGNRFIESMRYLRTYPAELALLRDLLPEIDTPVQIIAGARDIAVPPVNGVFLHARLPDSELHTIDAGHFAWEEGAVEYAALVAEWWASRRSSVSDGLPQHGAGDRRPPGPLEEDAG